MQIVRTPSKYLTRLAFSDIDFIITYHEATKKTPFEKGVSLLISLVKCPMRPESILDTRLLPYFFSSFKL
jgi:hypothetical protein